MRPGPTDPLVPWDLQGLCWPARGLTLPTGGGALRCSQLLPVVIPASPRRLGWHHIVWPTGRKSIWMPDWEGLCRFRGEYFRGPAVQVFLLLLVLFLFSLVLASPFCYQLPVEGLA